MSSISEKKYSAEEIQIESTQEAQDLYTPVEVPNTTTNTDSRWSRVKTKFTTVDGWIGDYDYRALWYIAI